MGYFALDVEDLEQRLKYLSMKKLVKKVKLKTIK